MRKQQIKDEDVREALKKFQGELSVRVQKPYWDKFTGPSHSQQPQPVKIYGVNGLVISLEPEFKKAIKPDSYVGEMFLVTPELIAEYKKQLKRPGGIDSYGHTMTGCICTGIVVDRAEDLNLETLHVKSALVQYGARELSSLVGPEWEIFLPKAAEHFGVQSAKFDKNSEYIAHLDKQGHIVGIDTSSYARAFSMLITDKTQLEPGIKAVYSAGCTIDRIIARRVKEMEKVMRCDV